MKRFEYHIYTLRAGGFSGGKIDVESMDQQINAFGAEGWELVSAFDTNHTEGATRDVILIFKREQQN